MIDLENQIMPQILIIYNIYGNCMINDIIIKFCIFGIWLISKLPDIIIRYFGKLLGLLGYLFFKKRVKIGLLNLSLCFNKMDIVQKNKIIYKHFQSLMIGALEYSLLFFGSKKRISNKVIFNNKEILDKYYQKRPVILLCPHFIGLDLAASKISLDYIGISIYSQQKNLVINSKLKQARIRFMQEKGGDIYPRNNGLRTIIRRLRQENIVFYYLPDQDLGEQDSIYVPFFDHPTCLTVSVLPKIVKLTNAVVIPMSIFRKKDKYAINFYPAWEDYPSGDLVSDIVRINKFIEQEILQDIEQYFWLHKRFKSQPGMIRGSIYQKGI
jgi:KDO2-lipid IV(A) lauroyltransferase